MSTRLVAVTDDGMVGSRPSSFESESLMRGTSGCSGVGEVNAHNL